jgi:hypothetical protein
MGKPMRNRLASLGTVALVAVLAGVVYLVSHLGSPSVPAPGEKGGLGEYQDHLISCPVCKTARDRDAPLKCPELAAIVRRLRDRAIRDVERQGHRVNPRPVPAGPVAP